MTYRIFAALGKNTLGDFCHDALVAAAIADQFDDVELTAYFRDNRPYKRDILDCMPMFTGAIAVKDNLLPIDCFGSDSGASEIYPWQIADKRIRKANLILAGDQFVDGMHADLPIPYMRTPEEWTAPAMKQLTELGIDPSNWFAVVYWKAPGYEHRNVSVVRDIADSTPYLAAIEHIKASGGQVVRIGHPGEKVPGVIDLANVPDSHRTQMFAVSRARFMLASASGPCVYGSGFNTPTAVTDQHLPDAAWRDHDFLFMRAFMGNRWIPHTAEDLCLVADEMIQTTVAKWREPTQDKPIQRPNRISLPLKIIPPTKKMTAPTKRKPAFVMDTMTCTAPDSSTIRRSISASLSAFSPAKSASHYLLTKSR